MNIYQTILEYKKAGKKLFALLMDPDNYSPTNAAKMAVLAQKSRVDYLLVGGSLLSNNISGFIDILKSHSDIPVVLFPGSTFQLAENADAILFLSLISGRNPELLIGNHVIAAPLLKKMKIEIIPTGYILVDGGKTTSVQYMSHTTPIPADKPDIVKATAMAGEMLGLKALYIEAGSGASKVFSPKILKAISRHIDIPIIYGGGIKSPDQLKLQMESGADMLVVGNSIEKDPDLLSKFTDLVKK